MQIKLNGNNEIVSFVTIGTLDNGIEINESLLPFSFVDEFKPGKFKYDNGSVVFNQNFEDFKFNAINAEVQSENIRLNAENEQLKKTIITLMNKIDELESNNAPS